MTKIYLGGELWELHIGHQKLQLSTSELDELCEDKVETIKSLEKDIENLQNEIDKQDDELNERDEEINALYKDLQKKEEL